MTDTLEGRPNVLDDILDEIEGTEIRAGYSGRYMYGRQCWAIKCDYLETAYEVKFRARDAGYRDGMLDQMGKGFIVYWPTSMRHEEENDEQAGEAEDDHESAP